MNKKLTLRLDDELIASAKDYAAGHGVSVSSLVENFFKSLSNGSVEKTETYSPAVSSMIGILSPNTDESSYREYLEEKYK